MPSATQNGAIAAIACLTLSVTGCESPANSAALAAHHMPAGRPIPYVNHQKVKEDSHGSMRIAMVVQDAESGDAGLNHLAHDALQHVASEYGVMGSFLPTHSPRETSSVLAGLGMQRMPLVIAVGSNLRDAVERASRVYPATKFLLLDDRTIRRNNVATAEFRTDEPGYVAGALAGWMEQTTGVPRMNRQNVVGVVANPTTASASLFVAGFLRGMRMADERGTALVRYLPHTGNTAAAARLAEQEIKNGADVVFAVGPGEQDVLGVCEKAHVYAIASYKDMHRVAPGTVLTSATVKAESPTQETVFDVLDGTFRAGATVWNLHNQGVGLTAMNPIIPQSVATKVRQLEDDIADGKVKVGVLRAD